MGIPDPITCRELVELVTDYLEGAMPPATRAHFEQHLLICEGCAAYLDQMRQTIRLAGKLGEDAIPPKAKSALLEAFRHWKKGRGERGE